MPPLHPSDLELIVEDAQFDAPKPATSAVKTEAFGNQLRNPSIFGANYSGSIAPGERCRFARQFNKDFRDYTTNWKQKGWSSDGIDHSKSVDYDCIDIEHIKCGDKILVRMLQPDKKARRASLRRVSVSVENGKFVKKVDFEKVGRVSMTNFPISNSVHVYFDDGTSEMNVADIRCKPLTIADKNRSEQKMHPMCDYLDSKKATLKRQVEKDHRKKLSQPPNLRRYAKGSVTLAASKSRPSQYITTYKGFGCRGKHREAWGK
jgi:hypothetical protein